MRSRRQARLRRPGGERRRAAGGDRRACARRRSARAAACGCTAPAQAVVPTPHAARLSCSAGSRRLPVEDWNAQISLLAGSAAASIMLPAGSACCGRWAGSTTTGWRCCAGRQPHSTWRGRRAWATRIHARARPRRAAPGGAPRGGARGDGPRRLHGIRRRPAGAARARGPGDALRPHDRADAAAGRPLRARPAVRPVRRAAPVRRGARDAAPAPRDHGRGRGRGPPSSSGRSWTTSRHDCSSTASASEFTAVGRRPGPPRARIQIADPPVRARLHAEPPPPLGARSRCAWSAPTRPRARCSSPCVPAESGPRT